MKSSAFIVSFLLACGSCGLPAAAHAGAGGDVSMSLAAQLGQADTVERLLAGGADPDARDAQGYTALMWAAENGRYGTVQVLLRHGADKNLRNDAGLSALDLATRADHLDLVALLRDAS